MALLQKMIHRINTDELQKSANTTDNAIPNEYDPNTPNTPLSPLTPKMTNGMANRLKKIDDMGDDGRRLIVGCDGTWVNSDDDGSIPSNVTRLCRALRSSPRPTSPISPSEKFAPAKKDQLIYYHRGIGTNGELASKWVGGGTGNELSEHVRECYGFISNNWRDGDDIMLFGFSRGAYTARTVSALIADVGLLTAIGMEWFYEIFEDWKNQNVPSKQVTGKVEHGVFKGLAQRPKMPSDEYKDQLAKRGYTTLDVPVKVVGVWDTVGSLGVPPIMGLSLDGVEPVQYSWVNTKVSQCVVHAFQAMGLDEHRYTYSPAIWEVPDQPNNLKTLKQCWFPGVHCNTGGAGGYQDQGLANITLAWMVSQLQTISNNDGTRGVLDFDEEYLKWVFKQNIEHVREVYPKEGFRGWGLGIIEETMTTGYSLLGARKVWTASKDFLNWVQTGDVPRTPGRYDEVDASSGASVKTGSLLKGTGECVHVNTRIRVAGGGKGVMVAGVEPEAYVPRGLQGWEFVGQGDRKDPLADGFVWKSGDGKTVLPEDKLGRFELELLGLSRDALEKGKGEVNK